MPFRDVTGHRRIVDLLSRSIARGTLPPSLIFAGEPGSGKRTTAIAVAQALNCLNRTTDACGVCAPCTRIARGVHPDLLVVEPAETGWIRIDPVREAIERTAYRPFEGRRRVVIIDDAAALMPQAQNALLKTLEEPPASSVFILITTQPDVLLPTVRSRCVRLFFAESGDHDVDTDAAHIAGRVLTHVAASDRSVGGRLESAKDLLAKTGSTAAADREQVAGHLAAMASLFRDIEVIATRAADVDLANPDLRPELERLAPIYGGERGVRGFTAIDEALDAIDRNVGIKVVADWLVLQL